MLTPPLRTRMNFDIWLSQMSESLEQLFLLMPEQVCRQMDFSPASLNTFEAWILARYPDAQSLLLDHEGKVLDGAGRYIGETYRRVIDVHWDIDLEHRSTAYYATPILLGTEEYRFLDSPFSTVTASADRRQGNYIHAILDNARLPKGSFYRGKVRYVSIISELGRTEWMSEINEAIDYFLDNLPSEINKQLNYTPESLQVIEIWIHKHCPNTQDILMDKYPEVSDGAARYIGEVFRRNLGGCWDIVLDQPSAKFNSLPIIIGTAEHNYKKCPVTMTTMARRSGTYIFNAFQTIAKHS